MTGSRRSGARTSPRPFASHFFDGQLQRTDRILKIEHTAVYDYLETNHVWEQPLRVQSQCRIGAFTEPELSASRVARVEDAEHVGFGRANLAPDYLQEPSAADFARLTQDAAHQELLAFVGRCLTSLSKDPSRCQGSLDCWLREHLYRGDEPVAAAMSSFADQVDRAHPDLPRFPCRGTR